MSERVWLVVASPRTEKISARAPVTMANTTIQWSVKSTVSIIGLHYSVQPTARPELWSIAEILCYSFSRQTQNSGTAYVFLPTQPKINAATEFKVVDKFFGRTAAGSQMRDVREVRFTSESRHVRRN
jgi:hypothetical protein